MADDNGQSKDEQEIKKDLTARLGVMAGEQQERLAINRAERFHLPYISLFTYPIDPDVIERIPKALAQQASAVLFRKQGDDVRIGVVNPAIPAFKQFKEKVAADLNTDPEVYVISHRSLGVALSRYRRAKTAEEIPEDEMRVAAAKLDVFEKSVKNLQELGDHITTLPPTEVLATIVAGAVKMKASDIHVEPKEKEARLRYRVDGVLQDITTFKREGWKVILSRIKVLSRLKLNVHDSSQDGSFVLRVGEDTYDIRVSILPGDNGENIVLRLLNRKTKTYKITDLGMKERDYKIVTEELKRSNGMILVTGPTGSGKTTSLVSFIQEINEPELKIITLEDPIEYRLAGVEQTQVDKDAGYSFATGLRAILRQDPDVIMVGEIRDTETASTAMHAALTGHLVFSTLHTNDAPGAVPRLIDIDIKPFVIAPAINLIIAQRLVRQVCEHCAEDYTPGAKLLEQITAVMKDVSSEYFNPSSLKGADVKFVKAKGCDQCNNTGYSGRVGVFEVMVIEGEIEELILASADSNQIREAAVRAGMTTIIQDAYLKVIARTTAVEEVKRITED